MGMFDWVTCELSGYEFTDWQTKDGERRMTHYLIGKDGMFYRSKMVQVEDLSSYPPLTYEAFYRIWELYTTEANFVVYNSDPKKSYHLHVKNGRVMHLLTND